MEWIIQTVIFVDVLDLVENYFLVAVKCRGCMQNKIILE